jgi:filamentous hemagglutinin family protein
MMNKHSSINRFFRLIWNESLRSWVPAAENARGRKKRNGRSARTLSSLVAGLGLASHAFAGGVPVAVAPTLIPPAPTTLPTGGQVVAGAATLNSSSTANSAVLNVDQTSQRAVVNWNTFNLGSAAQVNFNQPGSDSATLNRVLDSNPSQIFGKITALGEVFLSNPNGVYFGKSASVDVGSLAATTNSIGDADFMAGKTTFDRNGATGSVVNEGELHASLGGYIALLAPEVRNSGVIVARMGTVALAAGESITLNLDGQHLAGITATPSAIATLVENKSAVIAPGGLIILSAKAADSLQAGVINNSGTLEATGLSNKGGRIVLEASTTIDNSGTINANAGADGSPTGKIEITAPAVLNSGTISAAGAGLAAQTAEATVPAVGGSIAIDASTISQSSSGKLDVSGLSGGHITLQATGDIDLAGTLTAAALDFDTASENSSAAAATNAGHGGAVAITSLHNVTLADVLVDASGPSAGGEITIQGGGAPAPSDPPGEPPTVALLGGTQLRTSSRRGQGGSVVLTADQVGLFDTSSVDASGATGGGNIWIGGGFHGTNPSIADADQVVVASGATINANATLSGAAGDVAVWSDGQTTFAGSITARGGSVSGAGGFVEVSGKGNLDFLGTGTVDAGAAHGMAGTLLLDPNNITVITGGGDAVANETFATTPATDSSIAPATITAITNNGTAVTLQANSDITISSSIVTNIALATSGTPTAGGTLTFQAGRSITVNATVVSDNGNINFTANDPGATASGDRAGGTATFINNSNIDAGSGTVTITMGNAGSTGSAGTISTGHVAAQNFIVNQNGPTGSATAGNIDLGESDIIGNLTITSTSAANVTNVLGTTGNAGNVVVRGIASISVGTGDVTINGPHTDFNIIGLTARNVTLNDTTAVQFGATTLSGNLTETTNGPIGSNNGSNGTAAVQVAGTTTLTANAGAFGIADPFINLTDGGNHFTGGVTVSVASVGAAGTGGYITLRDSGDINVAQSTTPTYLQVQAGGSITTGTVNAGSNVTLTAGTTATTNSTTASSLYVTAGGAASLGATTLGLDLTVSSGGAITNTGAISVPRQTILTAGATNDIILDNANNAFAYIRIVSADNVTLVDENGIVFGAYDSSGGYTSHIYGNLSLTAGGDINQIGNSYYDGYSAIEVDGNTTFTANASAPINLYLGTTDPFNGNSGQTNNFAGSVTLARSGPTTGFSTVELRNTNASAAVLNGLTSVGTLANVYLFFDNAPSVLLPGMTVTGNLYVSAPSVANSGTASVNTISQSAPIVVGGSTVMSVGATGDIILNNASNDFYQFGIGQSRNTTVNDLNAIVLFSPFGDQQILGNLTVVAGGDISDLAYRIWVQNGTASFNAGSNDVTLMQGNIWNIVEFPSAHNVNIQPFWAMELGSSTISGTLTVTTYNGGYALTQVPGSVIDMTNPTAVATFNSFGGGITLAESGNVFGPLAISGSGAINIEENDAITQASAWNSQAYQAPVTLTTANNQAILLTQSGNFFGPLTITQIKGTAPANPGAVSISETADYLNGMTQGSAWTVNGTTTLDSGSYSITLNNPNNVFGPLQVTGATGSTGNPAVASTVTIFAKSPGSGAAITDVGSTGAWNTGSGTVMLVAYDSSGTTAGGGNIDLENPGNVLGPLYIKAAAATITENADITDGPSLPNWDGSGDSGWVTSGTTELVVANPTGKSINLSNLSNQLGPLGINTTGTPGTLSGVLVTDNSDLTQAAVWNVGAAPVTLDARAHAIDLSDYPNVLGDITINTVNGTPSSVSINEDDPITQGTVWTLPGVPVTLSTVHGQSITVTNAQNVLGDLTLTGGGAASITENDDITQGNAWVTGATTLSVTGTGHAIILQNTGNVLGGLALSGAATSVSITENDDITQSAVWQMASTPFTLTALNHHNIVLSQAENQLGALTLAGQNATVVEDNTAGIVNGGAWIVPGLTTLTAGTTNPIALNASPNSDFGSVNIVSASDASLTDTNGISFAGANVSGTLVVSAGGVISQTGAITAPSLQLIGAGNANLPNTANNVQNLAAGFSGGDLTFANSGDLAVAVVNGTTGVNIGAHNVTLSSATGTVTNLASVNASSGSLTVDTGAALSVPQISISGAQTYTAGGGGITLGASVTSTAPGAITFNSPVTLAADLVVQSDNSPVKFAGTLAGGSNQLKVNAGTGTAEFDGVVSALGATSDASAALDLTSSGAVFYSTVDANNGLAVTGPVVFKDTVTLADGAAASVFTGLVTLGKVGGMGLSGYNNMSFSGGVLLQNGPATINSNNSGLTFSGAGNILVSGPFALTLNSGTAALTGLSHMGTDLTALTVTALDPTIPAGGLSISGAQTYTATNGSVIHVGGNVTSTAAGAIGFESPVTLTSAATISSTNSPVVFASTVDGNDNLTVNSGTGPMTFAGAVGAIAPVGSGTGASIALQGSGTTTFDSTVQTRSGITAAGPVVFDGNVTLGDGNTGSTFTGLVTSGGTTGNTITGYDGIAFDGGLTLAGGPVSVTSNGSTLNFGGPVSGAETLTLNALANGAGTVTGLSHIGFSSNLTGLDVTAQTLSLPSGGLAVAGPMSFTAAGGITVNGAVGNSSNPATGEIDFNSPVTLATGAITVTTQNAPVNFNSTVDGGEALIVNAGTGATTFASAVGGAVVVSSIATDAGGTTTINASIIHTSGAQTYNDALTLGADTTLTGVNVVFHNTVDGAHALTVDDSGITTFAGVVGGTTALTSITTDAPGAVAVNASAVTTSGAQTYNELMTLGSDATFTGSGVRFGNGVNGAHALTVNAGTAAAQFGGAVGGTTPLTSVTATGNTVSAGNVRTTGAQTYTGAGGVTLDGALVTTDSPVTVTGPTTLAGDTSIATTGGDITFSGATSTINGDHDLTLTAGAGNVVLGGEVGGLAPLAGLVVSGNDLTLPGITTVANATESYTALDNITLSQSRTVNTPVSFTADADNNGQGSFILLNGVSLTASNNTLAIRAADLDLQGNSTLSSGSGLMTITASDGRNIALGGTDAPGQMTITGDELSRINTSGGLNLVTTGAGWIHVNGITQTQSQNITGTLGLDAQGTGAVGFITAPSTFNAIQANAVGGLIDVGVNLTTTNDPIEFVSAVSVSGASTLTSGGGDIHFDSALAVDNNLAITTGNGALTFGGAVGSNQTLTLNLGGGSVTGLGELQPALTGLTVNSTSGITLPAFTINGPQVYNTGPITVTGNLGGVGITFNNLVDVVPASGTALTMNSGTGTLAFNNLASFNAVNMTLIGDEINFSRAVTGSGSLAMVPYTSSRNIAVGNTTSISGLNLTAAELAWLPIGTLSSLTIGNSTGTGSLDVAGTLNAPGTPVTLNGGGGITQSGGSVTSGPLTLYAASNPISLTNSSNAFGAVAIDGSPSAVSLTNTGNITQLGSAAWALGSAPVTLNAGSHDITVNNAGNTFGTLVLNGANVQVTEAAAMDIGASTITKNLTAVSSGAIDISGALQVTGNVALTAAGEVSQDAAAALTIGGNLSVTTTVNAGDVTLNNSGAVATMIGQTLIGGDYTLTATGEAVSQQAGTNLQVAGNATVSASAITLAGAGNLIGGTTTLPNSSTVELRQSGIITLGDRTDTGNLTVVSEATNRTFSGSTVHGNAIVLNDAANNIGGSISVSASPPTIGTSGAPVETGIIQTAGTSVRVSGIASFTAENSSAGSLGIILNNSGNSFGTLALSGTTVSVTNSALGTTTIGSALATTSLTLNTAGAVAQTGAITTPALSINSTGSVILNNAGNDVATLAVVSGGNPISYVDANDLSIGGINAGGAAVSLTAGGAGNLSQTAALQNVTSLTANAGGAVNFSNTGNTIQALAASTAGTGFQLYNSGGGLAVNGIVSTATGDLSVRTTGDLTLSGGSRLEALTGNLVASTENDGNFINDSDASALLVGSGDRWLVYSDTPDLVAGAHTVKGGLTSSFRHYGATYASYSPGSVTESGNGFIYSQAASALTVSATIVGTPSQVYGDTPTASLGYTISSGLLDSEDNASNIVTGGAAAYNMALSNTLSAGSYTVKYTGGLTSNYTLVAATTGPTYTVTPAPLTYTADTASRIYGAANPAFSGTISGFKLTDTAGSVLSGTANWTSPATATSNVGQYAINGSGYSLNNSNYTFVQAAGNAAALTIGQASLTVTANNDSKSYDGNAYSGGAGVTYSGFANGESGSVLGGTLAYGGNSQGARNAGTYTIIPAGLTSGNYDITYDSGTLTVGKANVTLTTANVTKTYDGTLAATGTAEVTGGTQLFGSDNLTGGTFAYTNANASTGDKTVTVSGITVNDGNGGGNYQVSYVNNTTSTINPASITVGSSNVTKTYDATLAASGTPTLASGTLYHNVSNGNAQDSLSGGTFAFTDPNAGTGNKTVTTSGVTVNDGNGGGNYLVIYIDNTTSTINPAPVSFAGTVADKTYDGTTTATLDGYTLTGMVGSQTLDASAAGAAFIDKNAGTGKTVNIGGITLSDGTNGGLASNYYINPTATTTGNINPKVLTVNAAVADKIYDGTTAATLESYGLTGFVGNEILTGVFTGTASFVTKDVGTDKGVTITGISLVNGTNGGLASNYTVSTAATSTANITPATLHVAGVVALDKVYDGTTTANLNTSAAVLAGVYGSDQVRISSITGTYQTKDVGTNKPIGAGIVILSGADAEDYTLVQPSGLSSSITPRPLAVTATGINKTYDGTTAATVTLADNRLAGDSLTVTSTDNFIDPSAGTGKYIAVSNIALAGTDAQDYAVNSNTATYANIAKAPLAVTATGINKVYDGTTSATVSLTDTPLPGDAVDVLYTSASYANKNAGNGKPVAVTGMYLSGADADDYTITGVASTTANITPAPLDVAAIVAPKTWNGNTTASVTLTDNRILGDQLTITDSGASFQSPTVGNSKPVIVTGIAVVGGADAGNYTLEDTTYSTLGDITGTASQVSGGTLARSPVMPPPVSLPPTTPPSSTVDVTLPDDFGGGTGVDASTSGGSPTGSVGKFDGNTGAPGVGTEALTSGTGSGTADVTPTSAAGGSNTATADAEDQVTVSLVRPANSTDEGQLTVSVPEGVALSGKAFSFALPASIAGGNGKARVRVSLPDGKPLPSWLKYVPATRAFVATAVPTGAIPLDLLITIGAKRAIVSVVERNAH